jgi:hypothetical protein
MGVTGDSSDEAATMLKESGKGIPLLAPFSTMIGLRVPFRKDIINLVPSAYQEMKVAIDFLVQQLNATRIGILSQLNDINARDYLDGVAKVALKVS